MKLIAARALLALTATAGRNIAGAHSEQAKTFTSAGTVILDGGAIGVQGDGQSVGQRCFGYHSGLTGEDNSDIVGGP